MTPARFNIFQRGSGDENYHAAYEVVADEIGLIRAASEVEDDAHYEETRTLHFKGVPAEVTVTSPSLTDWRVEIRPEGQAEPVSYAHDVTTGDITLRLPSPDGGEATEMVVPRDSTGSGILTDFHRTLFYFGEAEAN